MAAGTAIARGRRGAGRRRWSSSLLLRELARAVARGEDPDELPLDCRGTRREPDRPAATGAAFAARRAAVLGDEFDEDLLLRMVGTLRPSDPYPNCLLDCKA